MAYFLLYEVALLYTQIDLKCAAYKQCQILQLSEEPLSPPPTTLVPLHNVVFTQPHTGKWQGEREHLWT